ENPGLVVQPPEAGALIEGQPPGPQGVFLRRGALLLVLRLHQIILSIDNNLILIWSEVHVKCV
ncbi:hypothetical protein, partial [Phascolarctobacterium faecium]|uniref:hypothetical protein n=1 Tax=Phascolarctobacterium faecium TaxID=33025 RepID=UPI003AB22BDE